MFCLICKNTMAHSVTADLFSYRWLMSNIFNHISKYNYEYLFFCLNKSKCKKKQI